MRCENAPRESAILSENVKTLHESSNWSENMRTLHARAQFLWSKCEDPPRQSAIPQENWKTSYTMSRFAWRGRGLFFPVEAWCVAGTLHARA